MEEVGAALAQQGVATVYLVHGQLGVEDDYTDQYARWFESSMHRPGIPWVPVRLFHWSGESSHVGRADGAVRLIDELASLDLQSGQRVLLWAHGDAGNLLALAALLPAGERRDAERFFHAASIYYRWPLVGCVDIPVWDRVRQRLHRGTVLEGVFFDVVTFGTLACYAWPPSGPWRRLHFLDDRHVDVPLADAAPRRSAWRARTADRRLRRFLSSSHPGRNAAPCPADGAVFREAGATLLVDYSTNPAVETPGGDEPQCPYTARQWLLFHAEEVARRFYFARSLKAA